MKLKVQLQERYSRVELIVRAFLGFFYIVLPHFFILFFVRLWGAILHFIAFWIILFTGKYPISMFEFQVGLHRWNLRLQARLTNVSDGYPSFGINGTDEYTQFEVEYPEKISRGLVIVRLLFGALYVYLPHGFILFFRGIFVGILVFLAWLIVLFTAKYPAGFHDWVVGQMRWNKRVRIYMQYLTDKYSPFTGNELPDEV